MSRLVVSEFMTLDGVMEAPGFEELGTGRTRGPCRRRQRTNSASRSMRSSRPVRSSWGG